MYHEWPICDTFVSQSGEFYYINVPQIGGGEKMYHIGTLVGEKDEFRVHSDNFE